MIDATKPRLAIIITHPIRYVVPLFKLLSKRKRIQLKVFYTYGPALFKIKKYDPEYREENEKMLPLFDGYEYEFVENIAKKKSTSRFKGINNPQLIEAVNAWQPNNILIFGWKLRSHLKAMRYFKGKLPVHFRGDSTLLDEAQKGWFKNLIRKVVLRWVYKHIDKAWYVGSNNKEYYRKFGLTQKQLIYVPHAIDNNRFAKTAASVQRATLLKQQLNINDDAVVFLFAGRFISKKGIDDVIEAFLRSGLRNNHLLLVGGGIQKPELKQKTASHSNIHILPYQTQTNMPSIYSAADVFVLSSKINETWGLVMSEALASGLVLIASDKCGGAADLIDEGENGFIFPVSDTDQLAAILSRLAGNKHLIKTMKTKSLEKIRSFSYDVVVEKIESLLIRDHQD